MKKAAVTCHLDRRKSKIVRLKYRINQSSENGNSAVPTKVIHQYCLDTGLQS